MNKVILATGLMVAYGYAMEHFIAWYSAGPYEFASSTTRVRGPLARRLLADDVLQRRGAEDLLVQEGAHQPAVMWFAPSW